MNSIVKFLLYETEVSLVNRVIEQLKYWQHDAEKIIVLTNQTHLIDQIDEQLWNISHDTFIPYSIDEEKVQASTSLLLTTDEKQFTRATNVINIGSKLPERISNNINIIEFVGPTEEQKHDARERYKSYKTMGFDVKMAN